MINPLVGYIVTITFVSGFFALMELVTCDSQRHLEAQMTMVLGLYLAALAWVMVPTGIVYLVDVCDDFYQRHHR